jgi:lipoate-protein ligase A
MALDAWLFEQHARGLHSPTLRFYTWNPAAISLGYHQRQFPAHWKQLAWNGQMIELVRRPTGGRAVLHQGDLTYAIVTSGLATKRQVAYQQICEFLIQGWRSLGVELAYGVAGRGYIHNPNCFGTATAADLVLADGTKLIGSAQKRQGNSILQHGSIRLQQNADLFQTVFGKAANLPTLPLRNQLSEVETIMTHLTQAAQACFDATFDVEPLSTQEWEDIQQKQHEFHPQD